MIAALCVSDKKLEFAKIVIKFLIDPEARYQQKKKALRFSKTLPGWDQVIEEYVPARMMVVLRGVEDEVKVSRL